MKIFEFFMIAPSLLMTPMIASAAGKIPDVRAGTTISVPIDDFIVANGGKEEIISLPPASRYEVRERDGKAAVAVMFYNEFQKCWFVGTWVDLDSDKEFQPEGMRWRFSLTDDGLLTWWEVPRK